MFGARKARAISFSVRGDCDSSLISGIVVGSPNACLLFFKNSNCSNLVEIEDKSWVFQVARSVWQLGSASTELGSANNPDKLFLVSLTIISSADKVIKSFSGVEGTNSKKAS